MIVFGGDNGRDTVFDDMWAYDPADDSWTELQPTGEQPIARSKHASILDPESGNVVVFGGLEAPDMALNDTWLYSPAENSWTSLAPLGSAKLARGGFAMAYDPQDKRMVLFGGYGLGSYHNDLWSFRIDP